MPHTLRHVYVNVKFYLEAAFPPRPERRGLHAETSMNKDLKYYLKLPYKIEIQPIPKEEGGGYFARLPDFGVMGITGDGDTVEEALKMLEEFKRARFKQFLLEKREMPEPGIYAGLKTRIRYKKGRENR